MGTDERVTVNGVEVNLDTDLANAIAEVARERPPAVRHLLIEDGTPTGEVMWDGVTPFDPGDGVELVKTSEWKGDPYTGPPEPEDVRARRTTEERLDHVIGQVREDLRGFDGMNAAQRQAAQRRTIRAVILLARVARSDHAGEVE